MEDEEDTGIVLVSYVPKVETEESNLNGSTEVESSPVGKVEEEPVKEEKSPIVVDIDIETPVEEAIVEKSVDDVKLDVNDNEETDDVNSADHAEEVTSPGAEEASEHSDHEEPSPTVDDQGSGDDATSYEIADEDLEITPEEEVSCFDTIKIIIVEVDLLRTSGFTSQKIIFLTIKGILRRYSQ